MLTGPRRRRMRSRALQIAALGRARVARPRLPGTRPMRAAAAGSRASPRTPPTTASAAAARLDADKLFGAIVKVSTRAVPDARSARSLGNEREGTGVVIGDDGLVLTIGYLIVEADDVKITDSKGRTLPARVVGYDHASGFGLVRAVGAARRAADPARRFRQDRRARSGDDRQRRRRRRVVRVRSCRSARSPATGNTSSTTRSSRSPPTSNWSGAALIDRDGKLLGIGSLIVREATDGRPEAARQRVRADRSPEADPRRPRPRGAPRGSRAAVARRVRRRDAGPALRHARVAGRPGRSGGRQRRRHHPRRRQRRRAHAGASSTSACGTRRHAGDEVPLKVLQGVDVKEITVRSIDRVEYFRPRSTI